MNRKMIVASLMVCFALTGCGGNTISSAAGSSGGAHESSSFNSSSGHSSSGASGGAKSSSSSSSRSSSSSSSSSAHKHTYSSSWSHDGTYHWHASTCGHDAVSGKERHDYEVKVVDPTYETEGYTRHTCTVCGYSYTDSETSKLEHNYSTEWSHDDNKHWQACIDDGYQNLKKDEGDHSFKTEVIDPTYDDDGCTRHTCTVCGYYYDDDITGKLKYAITWEDSDGTVLRTDQVEKGETPSYGEDPEKEMEQYETYSFAGWEPAITPASCDMTYKATYQIHKSENEFTVKFNSNGGDEFSVTLTKKKDATLTLPDTWPYKEGYVFCGWRSIYEEKVYGAEDEFDGNFNVVFFADWLPICSNCDGSGGVPKTCSACDGKGKITTYYHDGFTTSITTRSCSACNGTGKSADTLNCSKCGGSGYTLEEGPKIEKVTPNSITLAEADSYEYSMDGSTWQASPTFSNLMVDTAYNFYQRKAAKGKVPHGLASKATSGTTLKSSYSITYVLNGGINDSDNPSSYSYESENITFKDPSREGYTFDGWYSDSSFESKVTDIPSGSSGNLKFYAKWVANLNKLTVEPEKASRGTVTVSGSGYTDEKITVSAKASPTYTFGGWYSNGHFVSRKNPYTFGMPNGDVSLTAVFMTKSEADEKAEEELTERQKAGIDPAINIERGTITYGLYPQTYVSDDALISSLNGLTTTASNGWYSYNGAYYAKKSATPYSSSYEFSDGTKIVKGTAYWFKCEPIEWEVLSLPSGGAYSLVSAALLDTHRYHSSTDNRTIDGKTIYPNNYEHSDIRKWLNGEFYNSAFSLSSSLIQTVTVDNSSWSAGYSSEIDYACGDTEDKVYLPSYRDYATSYVAMQCKPTDWAKASGAWYSTSSSYLGNGYYWTRSPNADDSSYAGYVYHDGFIDYGGSVYYSNRGVRPSLSIKIA